MWCLKWSAGACALLIAASAHAQQHAGDMYAGVALGTVWNLEVEENSGAIVDDMRAAGVTVRDFSTGSDDRAFAWSVYAGYAVSEMLALEAGYLGSGKVSMRIDVSGSFGGEEFQSDAAARARRSSFYGALVGYLPIDSFFSPFGKIGVRRWELEVEGTASFASENTGDAVSLDDRDTGFSLLVGVGADMPMTDSVSLRIEYLYLPLGEDDGGDEHRGELGVRYTF